MKPPHWMRRLHLHYNDPQRPDRLTEDVGGLVIAIVVLLGLFFWLPLR